MPFSTSAPVAERSRVATLPDGAPVYDAEGYRLGFVEAVDLHADSFTLLQAGYVLGLLANSYEVPGTWVRRADPERVELSVPAAMLEPEEDVPPDAV